MASGIRTVFYDTWEIIIYAQREHEEPYIVEELISAHERVIMQKVQNRLAKLREENPGIRFWWVEKLIARS
jgi:hypothetical protein